MKCRALVWGLIFISCFDALSQSPYFRKHPLPFEYKNSAIHCVLQDRDEFLWFGTTMGIVRYNGSAFRHFLPFAGSENHVVSLYQDRQGKIWAGMQSGRVALVTTEKTDSALFRATSPVTGFAEDRAGNLWIATYGEGIFVITPGGVLHAGAGEGLADQFVYSIAHAADAVFAGTDQGISQCRVAGSRIFIENLGGGAGIKDNIITSLTTDARGVLWAGSESAGIARYDSATRRFTYPVHGEWSYGRVTSILPMHHSIWIGTAMNGVIEIDPAGEFINPLNELEKSLPRRITGLCRDKEGNVWIASATSSVLSGHPLFSFLLRDATAEPASIQAIISTNDGAIIYSTRSGVYTVSPRSRSPRPRKLSLGVRAGAQVISLFEDATGAIWLGTFDQGVYRYHPRSGQLDLFNETDGLVNNNVLSIAGNEREIWFATLGGVSQCALGGNRERPVFRNYTSESGIGSNYIYKIFIDRKKRVWFATDGKGVSMLENGKFRNFTLSDGLKSSVIYSIAEDRDGQIWVSSSNAGIYRFDGSAFQSFSPRNGLRDLAIASIVGDRNGNLLIVSRQGVDVLDPKSGTVFYHGLEFGINDIDPDLNAYAVDSAGNIWLGSQRGIIRYDANIPPLRKWPETRINELQVFLNRVDPKRNELAHDENHVSFDYVGFWYHDPEEVSYKVKLEGHDREWVNSKNHFITYPNLPPGDYTFMVQSSATNHFDGAPVKSYAFTIAPPFHQTKLFFILSAVVIGATAFLLMREREKRLKARERVEKEKIEFQFETLKNQVNPHFLFNSFNTLVGVIEEDRETAIEYVLKLSDFYRDILVNREKEVIPLSTELEMIRNYYFLQTKRYKDNFRMTVDVTGDLTEWFIPPLTLQLLVENAIKHNIISRDKPLDVRIVLSGEFLVVENNLQRKIVHEPSTGVGLANITNRFALLTRKPVRVEETDNLFRVAVPLINRDV